MDLNTLASNLRAQASANSTLVLDATVFPDTMLNDIRTAFALASGANLTIAGVKSSDIPTSPTGGTLTISAGTASVLNQSNVGIGLAFTAPGGTLQAVITATMSGSWKFSDSFKDLDVFPFQTLSTPSASFVYTTTAQTTYAWPGEPTFTIALQPGLNFLSQVTLGNFSAISSLLGALIGSNSFKFYGAFSPTSGQQLPVGTLRAPLGTSTFSVGVAPNALSLSNPTAVVRIGTADAGNPLQQIDLLIEATFQDTLQVAVGMPMTGSTLEISTTPLPNQSSITSLIQSLPGGSGFTSYIPSELSSIFSNVGLDSFSMVVTSAPKVSYLSLSISTLQPWNIISNVLVLNGLNLQIQIVDPTGLNWTQVYISASAEFFSNIFTGQFAFNIGLQKLNSWEVSTISGAYYGSVNLGDIVGGILGNQNSVPAALRAISFSNFGVNATRSTPGSPFTYSFYGSAQIAFPVLDQQLVAQLNLAVTKTPTGYTIQLTGAMVIGNETFTLELDLGAVGSRLVAKWANTGSPLGFQDIASAFGWGSMPAMPESLDLGLTDAEFIYDFTGGTIALSAHSVHYGQILFATLVTAGTSPNPNQRVFLFALDVPLNVQLSDLPVVGEKLPQGLELGVQDLQIIVASADLAAGDVTALNALITSALGDTPLAPKTLAAGLTFSTNLQLGGSSQPVIIPLTGGASQSTQGTGTRSQTTALVSTTAAPVAAPAYQAGAKWFNIGRTFGPVQFQRVGLQYQDGVLFFLLDASLSFSALALSCQGLGLGSPLTNFDPQFHLDGIGVDFSSGPVTISGAMLSVPAAQLPKGVDFEYLGAVTIEVQPWMISGVASYARVQGSPSFFLFAQVTGAFGGPPAFFITGFMGGFGYNSKLTLPEPDQVYKFPFVAGLDDPSIFGANPTPVGALAVLSGANGSPAVVTPSVGDNWIAAGILFRSFELVLGHALVAVEFGHDFQVALLGLASTSLPQGATTDAYAYIELQLEAVFKPDDGYFGLTASLTPTSFVLTKACHLTGGFAFCLWFGPNPHAGDFVVTVGGYHPAFTPPTWYPQVSPVGFNWQVDSDVTIKGSAYFALTPSAIMAGGSLEALFQSGDIKAWFIAYANLLITWKPFHFEASIGISIGASVRVDLLFTTVTLSFELGATLDLWGPPTGGIVHVHLYIVSFSIPFGTSDNNGASQALSWTDFTSLLPQKQTQQTKALAASATPPPLVLGVQVNRGLTRQGDAGLWYVRADELSFTATTAVPATSFSLGSGQPPPLASGAKPVTPPASIAIRPMGIGTDAKVTSAHTLTLTFIDENTSLDLSTWTQVPQAGNVPEALWGAPVPSGSNPAPSSATINLPTGVQLIAPAATLGYSPGAMDLSELVDPLGGGYAPLTPATQADPIPAPQPSDTAIATIAATLASAPALQAQQALLQALGDASASPPSSSPLSLLAASAPNSFSQNPLIQN